MFERPAHPRRDRTRRGTVATRRRHRCIRALAEVRPASRCALGRRGGDGDVARAPVARRRTTARLAARRRRARRRHVAGRVGLRHRLVSSPVAGSTRSPSCSRDLGQRRIIVHDGGDVPRDDRRPSTTRGDLARRPTMTPVAPTRFVVRGALGVPVEALTSYRSRAISALGHADPAQHGPGVLEDVDRARRGEPAGARAVAFGRRDRRAIRRQADGHRRAGSVAREQRRSAAALKGQSAVPRSRIRSAVDRGGPRARSRRSRSIRRTSSITSPARPVAHVPGQRGDRSSVAVRARRARVLTAGANSAARRLDFDRPRRRGVVPAAARSRPRVLARAALEVRPDRVRRARPSFPGGNYYVASSVDGAARAVADERGLVRVEGWSDGFRAMKSRGGPAAPPSARSSFPAGPAAPCRRASCSACSTAGSSRRCGRCVPRGSSTAPRAARSSTACSTGRSPTLPPAAELGARVETAELVDAAVAAVGATRRESARESHLAVRARPPARRYHATRARRLAHADRGRGELAHVERALSAALRPLPFVSLLAQREIDARTYHRAARGPRRALSRGVGDAVRQAARRAVGARVRCSRAAE